MYRTIRPVVMYLFIAILSLIVLHNANTLLLENIDQAENCVTRREFDSEIQALKTIIAELNSTIAKGTCNYFLKIYLPIIVIIYIECFTPYRKYFGHIKGWAGVSTIKRIRRISGRRCRVFM